MYLNNTVNKVELTYLKGYTLKYIDMYQIV